MFLIDKISEKNRAILFTGLSFALASIPICIVVVLVNSGNIEYESNGKKVNFSGKAKKSVNNAEFSNQALEDKLKQLDKDFKDFKQGKKALNDLEDSYKDFLPTANQAIKNTEELNNFVEEEILETGKE